MSQQYPPTKPYGSPPPQEGGSPYYYTTTPVEGIPVGVGPPPPWQPPPHQQQASYYPSPAGGGVTQEPLLCGIGLMWLLFIAGFFFWPLWFVALCFYGRVKRDGRERAGYIANVTAAMVLTLMIVVMAIVMPLTMIDGDHH